MTLATRCTVPGDTAAAVMVVTELLFAAQLAVGIGCVT
jgi:hypothetical protein